MYNVISTGTAALILYSVSLILSVSGFYSRNFHRKIWNIVLAVTFTATALAGVFLALQVTYKWEISFIKTILKWHVECGTGLAFTGLIHFVRHLPYFTKKTDIQPENAVKNPAPPVAKREISVNLFIIGFVSTSAQLLLMREMMNISGGYELVAGTFLGSWLIGSAAGSAMAGKQQMFNLRQANFIFMLGAPLSILLLVLLSGLFMTPGEVPSYFKSIIYTLVVLVPVTFVSGYSFVKITGIARISGYLKPGRSFAIETGGGVAAGIIVSIACSGLLFTYRLFLLIIILNAAWYIFSFLCRHRTGYIITATAALAAVTLIALINPDRFFRQQLLSVINVQHTADTPYGNITRGEYGGDSVLYYNHHLVKYENDQVEREENIHYALLQRKTFNNVLVISGDIRSSLPELHKHNIKTITYVERDPALAGEMTAGLNSNNLNILHQDAFRFMKSTEMLFDAVLLLTPPPSTLMLNRFYTVEFFSAARERMTPDGIFLCSPGPGENYFNKESTVLYSSVYNALKSVFSKVEPLVGNKLYYIASGSDVSISICGLLADRNISNDYVSTSFLSDDLIRMKSEAFTGMIDTTVQPNTLVKPVASFHYQSYSLSRSMEEKVPSFILIAILFLFPLLLVRPGSVIMYTASGALAGFEIITMVLVQSTAGNAYLLTSMIIASTLLGLLAGAGYQNLLTGRYTGSVTAVALLVFYGTAGLSINGLLKIENLAVQTSLLMCLPLIPSFMTGQIFKYLTDNSSENGNTSAVYSADLAGSALGFIAVSAFAIPLAGLRMSLFFLCAAIFTGLLFGTLRGKY